MASVTDRLHLLLIGIFLLLWSTPQCQCVGMHELQHLANINTDFGLRMYKRLAEDAEVDNIFFSPLSISTAFAMVYLGARNQTAKQLEDVLGFKNVLKDLHPTFAELCETLFIENEEYVLTEANRLFGAESYTFREEFLEDTKDYYDAELESLDFSSETEKSRVHINKWVKGRTGGNIRDLLQPGIIDAQTILVLVNAIYFNALWVKQFTAEDTTPGPFYLMDNAATSTNVMHITSHFLYIEDEEMNMKMIEMPYKGEKLGMYILLPNEHNGLTQLEDKITVDKINDLISDLSSQEVEVSLPKFKVTQKMPLVDILKALGIRDLFGMRADLSGIDGTEKLFVNDALHQAFVDVNEKGTEAAGSTAVVVGRKSANPKFTKKFNVDHPFLFFIREIDTKSVLFLGRIQNPGTTTRAMAFTFIDNDTVGEAAQIRSLSWTVILLYLCTVIV